MTIVAVSQRVDVYPDRNEQRDALDQRLIEFLLVGGCVPVPIPNVLFRETLAGSLNRVAFDAWVEKIKPQAVLLSGGNDVTARQDRDLTEGWLLDYAEKHTLPALGLCRGMQMMGIWAGAGLKTVDGHVRTRHILVGEIYGEANSYHNQTLLECPPCFAPLAHSEDGEIEAMRHNILPWEGWMWHPEREANFAARDVERLKVLFCQENSL